MTGPLLHADLKTKQRRLRDGFPDPLALRAQLARTRAGRTRRQRRALHSVVDRVQRRLCRRRRARGGWRAGAFRAFFATLIDFDTDRRIYRLVWQRFPHEIRMLLENQYVFAPFWHHHNGNEGYADWRDMLDRSRKVIASALTRQDSATILSVLFDRLYVLRNQLVHGGATWQSEVNRAQVRDGAALLGTLLPVFIDLMMDHRDHNWPMPHYPVVE
jgi:hypothetical protein